MTAITSVNLIAFAIEVVVLLACATVLVGAMIRYRRHVLYRSGVLWLAASLLLVTAGAVVELWGFLATSDTLAVLAMAFYAAASAAILAASWTFARGFIRFERPDHPAATEAGDTLTVAAPDTDRGFEDAGN